MKKIIAVISLALALCLSVAAFSACRNTETGGSFSLIAPDGAPVAALADMWGEDFGDSEFDYTVTGEANIQAAFLDNGGAEFVLAPLNIGANMHLNAVKEGATTADYKLLNVTSWGVLYYVTTESGYETYDDSLNADEFLSQFDGKTISTIGLLAIPGKTVQYLFDSADAEVTVNGSDASTIQQAITKGDAITAVFAEPAISALKANGREFTVLGSVSDVYKAVTGDEFPMAGLFVRSDVLEENSDLVGQVDARVKSSVEAFNKNPEAVGTKAENIENCTLKGSILKNAAPKMNVQYRNAEDSKTAVTELLKNIGVTVGDDFFAL